MQLSKQFIAAIKLNKTPAYKIAHQAGVNPSWLSKIMIGAQGITPTDDRILRIGNILGLKPNEIFEPKENEQC